MIALTENLVYLLLLGIGGILLILHFKLMLYPGNKGVVVEFEDMSPKACNTCRSTKLGRMSITVKVKMNDGEIVEAEISPCTICMEKIRIGSRVGVTKVGSRTIAQTFINLSGKKAEAEAS